jgi:hypothetical protein
MENTKRRSLPTAARRIVSERLRRFYVVLLDCVEADNDAFLKRLTARMESRSRTGPTNQIQQRHRTDD